MAHIIIPLVCLAFLIGLWVATSFYVSKWGWARVAHAYSCKEPPNGAAFHKLSGTVTGRSEARYNDCLTAILSERGFYLETKGLFFLGHPPLLLPYNGLKEVKQDLDTDTVSIRIETEVAVFRITLPHDSAEFLLKKRDLAHGL